MTPWDKFVRSFMSYLFLSRALVQYGSIYILGSLAVHRGFSAVLPYVSLFVLKTFAVALGWAFVILLCACVIGCDLEVRPILCRVVHASATRLSHDIVGRFIGRLRWILAVFDSVHYLRWRGTARFSLHINLSSRHRESGVECRPKQ